MALNEDQAYMYVELNRWWKSTSATLTRQRREIAGAALAAPYDLALQAATVAGLEGVQRRHIVCLAAVFLLGSTSLLAPEQLAEAWVSSWPYMSLLTAILDACKRHHGIDVDM